MSSLNLWIKLPNSEIEHIYTFVTSATVGEICDEIRSTLHEVDNNKEYGLFFVSNDPLKSMWLEDCRPLSYYAFLSNNSKVEYRSKLRIITIRSADGRRKKIKVDDDKSLNELMPFICNTLGVLNYKEQGLMKYVDGEEIHAGTIKTTRSISRSFNKKNRLLNLIDKNWLDGSKTLQQLGVKELDELELRRRYFYSEDNLLRSDRIQLTLDYEQVKEDVLKDRHVVTKAQAIKLGAIQCQVEMGPTFDAGQQTKTLQIKQYLPKKYWKCKNINQDFIQKYDELRHLREYGAKLCYVQLCRSLPTYGTTYFHVKEKDRDLPKLKALLFGINKWNVMRVDLKTGEILEKWPYQKIRSWNSGNMTLVLDFGAYYDEKKYAILTPEVAKISDLISYYVSRSSDRLNEEATARTYMDECDTITEGYVAPLRGNMRSENDADMRLDWMLLSNSDGFPAESRVVDLMEGVLSDKLSNSRLQEAIRGKNTILSYTINSSLHDLDVVMKKLSTSKDDNRKSDEFCHDVTNSKAFINDLVNKMNTSLLTAMVAIQDAFSQLLSNDDLNEDSEPDEVFTGFIAAIKLVDIEMNKLVEFAQKWNHTQSISSDQSVKEESGSANLTTLLTVAYSDMLRTISTLEEKGTNALLESFGLVGDAGYQMLSFLSKQSLQLSNGELNELVEDRDDWSRNLVFDCKTKDELLDLLPSVENLKTSLVQTVQSFVDSLHQETEQLANLLQAASSVAYTEEITQSIRQLHRFELNLTEKATNVNTFTTYLVACAKVNAITLEQPQSNSRVINAANEVTMAVGDLLTLAKQYFHCNDELLKSDDSRKKLASEVEHLVYEFNLEVEEVIRCSKKYSIKAHQDPILLKLSSLEHQFATTPGNGKLHIDQYHLLDSVLHDFTQHFERKSIEQPSVDFDITAVARKLKTKLLIEERKLLANLMQKCQQEDQQMEQQQVFINKCTQSLDKIYSVCSSDINLSTTDNLVYTAQLFKSSIRHWLMLSEDALNYCSSDTEKQQLTDDLNNLHEHMLPQLNSSCMKSRQTPFDLTRKKDLLNCCSKLVEFLGNTFRLTITIAHNASNDNVQYALVNATHIAQTSLKEFNSIYTNCELLFEKQQKLDNPDSIDAISVDKDTLPGLTSQLEELVCKLENLLDSSLSGHTTKYDFTDQNKGVCPAEKYGTGVNVSFAHGNVLKHYCLTFLANLKQLTNGNNNNSVNIDLSKAGTTEDTVTSTETLSKDDRSVTSEEFPLQYCNEHSKTHRTNTSELKNNLSTYTIADLNAAIHNLADSLGSICEVVTKPVATEIVKLNYSTTKDNPYDLDSSVEIVNVLDIHNTSTTYTDLQDSITQANTITTGTETENYEDEQQIVTNTIEHTTHQAGELNSQHSVDGIAANEDLNAVMMDFTKLIQKILIALPWLKIIKPEIVDQGMWKQTTVKEHADSGEGAQAFVSA